MKISELNTKIDFVLEVAQDGPFDDLEPSYKLSIPNIWAKKTKLLGKEQIALGAQHNIVQVNFIVRDRKGIDEDMFIQHENVIYNIVGYERLKSDNNYMLIATVKKQVVL